MENIDHRPQGDEQPLPPSLASRLAGWSGVARQYPIFSTTWFGYRMRSFVAPMLLLAVALVLTGAFTRISTGLPGLYAALCAIWLVVALALFLGRALAVLVYRQKWTPPREAAGILCALAFGIAVALPLTPLTRITQPATVDQAAAPERMAHARESELFNLVIWLLLLIWLGGALDLAAYFRQRRLLREADLLAQVARYKDRGDEVEMQLSVLASQVEPHFLFNTLSGVRAAMLSDPARGVVIIDHLVDYLRSTIPQLRADRDHLYVALGSQCDSAQAYLGIIQARLPRLQTRVECPTALRGIAVPPLMLISLVENAVKHGIELKKGPGMITVVAARTERDGGSMLELTVSDDGVGFGSAGSGSGIGLSNIRARLAHLYGGEAALSLQAGESGGVVARIVLPIRAMAPGQA